MIRGGRNIPLEKSDRKYIYCRILTLHDGQGGKTGEGPREQTEKSGRTDPGSSTSGAPKESDKEVTGAGVTPNPLCQFGPSKLGGSRLLAWQTQG